MKPGYKGFKRIVRATKFSWKGLKASFKHEEAFRQELMLLLIGTPFALWLGDTGLEKAVMIGSLMLLLIVEVLNSAIEAVVDRTGDEWHKLSGRAKDMGSAAVFLAIINVIIIWGLVLVF
jgi:diacylglycerol kinase (ATP)